MSEADPKDVHRTIERVARESYGRLVAYLSSHTRDVAGAEDALSEALIAALKAWPRDGVARNPEAWLLTTARHSLIDFIRHQRVALASEPTLLLLTPNLTEPTLATKFPDDRLKLLFVCAHPAIDPSMHTPLMLQTVLQQMRRASRRPLPGSKTMGLRLVRAKTKIRDGGIGFEIPQDHELPQRLDAVLEAIYAAFGIGWDDMAGGDQRGRELAEEAVWLARVLLQLMPDEAEAHGLLSLMLHCEARRAARRGPNGQYVPLSDQDPRQWSLPLIEEAEKHLAEAAKYGRLGRFQIEAAIQSVHAERAHSGRIDWTAIAFFYESLIGISPTLGTLNPRGYASRGDCRSRSEAGLVVLDAIELDLVSGYQPYWAVRAHLFQRLGKTSDALNAYDRAIGLAEDPAVREFLLQKRG